MQTTAFAQLATQVAQQELADPICTDRPYPALTGDVETDQRALFAHYDINADQIVMYDELARLRPCENSFVSAEALPEEFWAADLDRSGYITVDESILLAVQQAQLQSVLDELAGEIESDSQAMHRFMDANNDGVVDLAEFKAVNKGLNPGDTEGWQQRRFMSHDRDQDGLIQLSEMGRYNNHFNAIRQEFEAADKNGDGKLSWEEYDENPVRCYDPHRQEARSGEFVVSQYDHDGVLTLDEIVTRWVITTNRWVINRSKWLSTDVNGDGTIVQADLQAYYDNVEPTRDPVLVEMEFTRADRNKDGKAGEMEMWVDYIVNSRTADSVERNHCEQVQYKIDTDYDEVITLDEIEAKYPDASVEEVQEYLVHYDTNGDGEIDSSEHKAQFVLDVMFYSTIYRQALYDAKRADPSIDQLAFCLANYHWWDCKVDPEYEDDDEEKERDLEQEFINADTDGDGSIRLQEVLDGQPGVDPDLLTAYFRAYDLDDDGQVDFAEYSTAAEMMGDLMMYENLPGEFFYAANKDQDGNLTTEEAKALVQQWAYLSGEELSDDQFARLLDANSNDAGEMGLPEVTNLIKNAFGLVIGQYASSQ